MRRGVLVLVMGVVMVGCQAQPMLPSCAAVDDAAYRVARGLGFDHDTAMEYYVEPGQRERAAGRSRIECRQ